MEQQNPKGERLKTMMSWIVIIYLLALAGFYFFQQYIFFHPKPLPADYTFHFKQKFIEKQIQPNAYTVTDIVRFLPQDSAKGVVLYFHGNRDNVERYAPYSEIFTSHGYECWMVDYPGFGKSTGRLTADSMELQADQMYVLALSMFKKENVIVYGKSMGTGPATYLASQRPCKSLILETPFYSLTSLVKRYMPIWPVGWLIKVNFDNGERLKEVTEPVTIFHGTDDKTITYSNAIRLKESLKSGDQFITIEGGQHNGMYDSALYKTKMDSLLH